MTTREQIALYEDALLRFSQHSRTETEANAPADLDETNSSIALARSLANRVARLGTVQYALSQASVEEVPVTETWLCHEREELDRQAQGEMKQWESLAFTDWHKDRPKQSRSSCTVDVDAFFDAYPECARAEPFEEESESSSDEEVDAEESMQSRNKKQVRCEVKVPREAGGMTPTLPTPPIESQPGKGMNPYARPKANTVAPNNGSDGAGGFRPPPNGVAHTQTFPPPNTMHVPAPQSQPPESWQPRQYKKDHPDQQSRTAAPAHPPLQGFAPPQNPPVASGTSWDEHCNQNPFQTAREYAQVGTQGEDYRSRNNGPDATAPYPPQALTENQTRPYGFNPYLQQHPPENAAPPPEKPLIRDSLRRKFQPPKRDAIERKGSNATSGPANPRSETSRGSGGIAQRPSSSNNQKNNEDEEDELPEELKRFGKDLVEKIENEIMDAGDPVTFDDIAGLLDAKQTIQEVICWPMKRPDLFTGLRRAPNGLLLYGPPGTGKTLIGKAIAHESGATFFSISSSSLTSKWIGEGEKLVRTMFAVAAYREPAVVFIDEIDSLLTQRKADENEASRRIKTEFLVQLDGTGTSGQGRVLVIGATNRPQELDEAARRRFVKRLYIPLPEESDRECLIRVLLGKNSHGLTDADIKKLAKETAGYSGADLKALSADAAMGPIRQLGTKALEVDVNDVPPIIVQALSPSPTQYEAECGTIRLGTV